MEQIGATLLESERHTHQGSPDLDTPNRELVEDLLAAVLVSGDANNVHLFSDCGQQALRSIALQKETQSGRVTWKHLTMFPKLIDQNRYVWVTTAAQYSRVIGMRDATGRTGFPISVILHGIGSLDIGEWPVLMNTRAAPFDACFVTSRATAEALQLMVESTGVAQHPRQSSRPIISTIARPVDVGGHELRDKAQCRSALGLPLEGLVIFCPAAAADGTDSNLELVILACKELLELTPELTLVIAGRVGDSMQREATMAASDCGFLDRVRWVRDIPASVRPIHYRAADIGLFLHDSIVQPIELSCLDAMANALPVVASDWGEHRDIVAEGKTGFLVRSLWNPIAGAMMGWLWVGSSGHRFLAQRTVLDMTCIIDRLRTLVANPQLRSRMGDDAREYVRLEHSPRVVGRQIAHTWARQWEMCESFHDEHVPTNSDFSQVFGRYASAQLDANLKLMISKRGARVAGDEFRSTDTSMVPELLKQDVSALLQLVKPGPVTLGEHLAVDSPFALEAAVWLLKKGFLAVAPAEDSDGEVSSELVQALERR
jgi:hypothetical protein